MTIHVPTSLTDGQLRRFKSLYKQQFGQDISDEKAEAEGLALMRFAAIALESHPYFHQDRQNGIDS